MAPSAAKAIPKVLQAIGENLEWNVGNFWKIDADLSQIRCAQTWSSLAGKPSPFLEINRRSLFSLGVELPGEVWDSKKPRWIADLAQMIYPRAIYAVKEGFASAVAFPVCLGEKMLGVMEFFSEKTKALDKNLLQTLDAISGQLAQFLERKETEERLKLAYEEMERRVEERTGELVKSNRDLQAEIVERKKIEREILEITQKEQRRFGSQLHDGLCQELAGILMFAKSLTQKMERENRLDIAELKKISDLLNDAVTQARNTARGLYPGELEGASLMHTLEELTLATQNLSGVSCHFHCPEPILINENDVATHLYKIAQEGISNAIQHGKAKSVEVSFIQNDNGIILIIADDGVGFTESLQNSQGIGLKIMKYRAHMMGATFQAKPNLPHGVILKCTLQKGIL